MLRRYGTRQLPGICWYPAKRTALGLRIKVAPRIRRFVLDRLARGLSGAFFFFLTARRRKPHDTADKAMAQLTAIQYHHK